ncbi:hypothetical protein K469DRAFT_703043 [Zopfia rhizophila CBS 207.26]|uniref:Uncharacterized protein n=1 Tax=Zopfia rhizophila CBS 207.26 TaxID=1314779 RepID=A0A6A6ED20_9PEZI|nr:hypothetical protein K469DRAFT_703043 [Zopfia rhizophila CBS 207.26]
MHWPVSLTVESSSDWPVFPPKPPPTAGLCPCHRLRAPRLLRPSCLNKFFAVGGFGALTSFVRGICDALTLTSSHKKRFPTPSPYLLSVSELVQAQGCPVVRLGRVHIGWLDKASFRPGCEPGSRTSGGFHIPVSLDEPP